MNSPDFPGPYISDSGSPKRLRRTPNLNMGISKLNFPDPQHSFGDPKSYDLGLMASIEMGIGDGIGCFVFELALIHGP